MWVFILRPNTSDTVNKWQMLQMPVLLCAIVGAVCIAIVTLPHASRCFFFFEQTVFRNYIFFSLAVICFNRIPFLLGGRLHFRFLVHSCNTLLHLIGRADYQGACLISLCTAWSGSAGQWNFKGVQIPIDTSSPWPVDYKTNKPKNCMTSHPVALCSVLSLLSSSARFLPSPLPVLHLPVIHTLPLPHSVRVICSHPFSVAQCLTPIRRCVCSRLVGRLGNALQVTFGETDLPLAPSIRSKLSSSSSSSSSPALIFSPSPTISLHPSVLTDWNGRDYWSGLCSGSGDNIDPSIGGQYLIFVCACVYVYVVVCLHQLPSSHHYHQCVCVWWIE